MNSMAPQFNITQLLTKYPNDLEGFRKELFEKGVLSKDYMDEGLMLVYHKYDQPITNQLQRECRSLIIDRTNMKIVSYSCETPLLNKEGMEFLVQYTSNNPTKEQIINTCYEGTYLSVFHHNSKWYVSTRRCLNSEESVFENNTSHFEMFEDVLKKSGYATFNDFTSLLDTSRSYYFVLIHHKNKHTLDYSETFGSEYTKLCFTTVRDLDMNEIDIYTTNFPFVSEHIFVPPKLDSIDSFAECNKLVQYGSPIKDEGIIVRVFDDNLSMYRLIKLQNINYQFLMAMGTEKNIFKGLVYLYQNDKLAEYFGQNQHIQNISKIVNPHNTMETYDTVGMVDAVFKVCTSEIFELFKNLWSIKTGKHQNVELYDMLPKEYKDVMYFVRGLYFKKKATLFTGDKNENDMTKVKDSHLKITDIYTYLKTLSTDTFVAFLRMRRLMLNWVKSNNTNKQMMEFSTTSSHCDKVHLKLCAIFTNKLFPNIMFNDLPPLKIPKVLTE